MLFFAFDFGGRTGNHEVNVCFWYRRVIWSIGSKTVGELRAANASWRRLKACAIPTSDPYSIQPTTSSQQRSFKPPHTVCLPCTYWAWKITASSYIRAFVTMYHVLDAYMWRRICLFGWHIRESTTCSSKNLLGSLLYSYGHFSKHNAGHGYYHTWVPSLAICPRALERGVT